MHDGLASEFVEHRIFSFSDGEKPAQVRLEHIPNHADGDPRMTKRRKMSVLCGASCKRNKSEEACEKTNGFHFSVAGLRLTTSS